MGLQKNLRGLQKRTSDPKHYCAGYDGIHFTSRGWDAMLSRKIAGWIADISDYFPHLI
jgi:hypothetical protein